MLLERISDCILVEDFLDYEVVDTFIACQCVSEAISRFPAEILQATPVQLIETASLIRLCSLIGFFLNRLIIGRYSFINCIGFGFELVSGSSLTTCLQVPC